MTDFTSGTDSLAVYELVGIRAEGEGEKSSSRLPTECGTLGGAPSQDTEIMT